MQAVAQVRAAEAGALLQAGHRLGALYLQGYNVECLLKHLHQVRGQPHPKSGAAGHDLRGLWTSANLPVSLTAGHAGDFLAYWTTSLRYESVAPGKPETEQLFGGARDLAARVTARCRTPVIRADRRRRR